MPALHSFIMINHRVVLGGTEAVELGKTLYRAVAFSALAATAMVLREWKR